MGFEVIAQIINSSGGIIPKTTSDVKNKRKTKKDGKSNVIWFFKEDKSK